MRRILIAALALTLATAIWQTAFAAPPVFSATSCDEIPNVGPDLLARLRCGTVAVPRDPAKPEAGSFALAVVVVASATRPALPDPVLYISGGPGAPLTQYTAYQAAHPYAASRDLVLIDQRGTGRSEPRLCPSRQRALLDSAVGVAEAVSPAEIGDALANRRRVMLMCRDDIAAQGIDPTDFSTEITVADLEAVRTALGVRQWNVFGESYGTTVAMTLAAMHPESIRSLVLDSVYPPDPGPPASVNVADALQAFFAACDTNPACASTSPHLAEAYAQAIGRVSQTPPRVGRFRLTATLFERVVGEMVYYPTFYAKLPSVITAVRDGHDDVMREVVAGLYADALTQNIPLNLAVECRDRPHYRTMPGDGSDQMDLMQPYAICADWAPLGPPPLVPAGSPIPTLILHGRFDPVSRLPAVRDVAARIGPMARVLVFDGIGHNVRHFSACAVPLVAGFIADPAALLLPGCGVVP